VSNKYDYVHHSIETKTTFFEKNVASFGALPVDTIGAEPLDPPSC